MATMEASTRVSCRKPRSTNLSLGGRRLKVNASRGDGLGSVALRSVSMGGNGFASVSPGAAYPAKIYEAPLAWAFKQ